MRRDKIHRHGEKETDDAETNHRFQALRRRWPFHLAEAYTHRRSLVAALLILLSTFYSYFSMLLLLTYVYIVCVLCVFCVCFVCVLCVRCVRCVKVRVFLVRLFCVSSFLSFTHSSSHVLHDFELSSSSSFKSKFFLSCPSLFFFSRTCFENIECRKRSKKKKKKKRRRREKGSTKDAFSNQVLKVLLLCVAH